MKDHFIYILILLILVSSCENEIIDIEESNFKAHYDQELYTQAEGLLCLSRVLKGDGYIEYADSIDDMYKIKFSQKKEIINLKFKSSSTKPSLFIEKKNDILYWTINGKDSIGDFERLLEVKDSVTMPVFKNIDGYFAYSINNGKTWINIEPSYSQESLFTLSMNNNLYSLKFINEEEFLIPSSYCITLIKGGDTQKTYYKDIFLDAGYGLTTRNNLAAATYLNYNLESVSITNSSDIEWQNKVIGGTDEDYNGRLLYPDGEPRYRILFVNGGSSRSHGQSLSNEARQNMRTNVDYPYYLSVWQGLMQHTGLESTKTGMFIEQKSPLLNYYDFGGDNYVANIRHNRGGYPSFLPEGTIVLARYDYPQNKNVHLQPSIWSSKNDSLSGIVIQEGSHPEEAASGECRDLTAAMMRYAVDRLGVIKPKGFLIDGIKRKMEKSSVEKDPVFSRIGDKQSHHFLIYVPDGTIKMDIRLNYNSHAQLNLMLRKGRYATQDCNDYQIISDKKEKTISIPVDEPGLWFVCVHNISTIESEDIDVGQSYKGNLELLNGVPYSIELQMTK